MIATSTTVPTVTCDGSKSGAFAFQTIPDAKASITAFSLFAPMIQINFQSSDKAQPTSPPSSSLPETSPEHGGFCRTSSEFDRCATGHTLTLDFRIQDASADGYAPDRSKSGTERDRRPHH